MRLIDADALRKEIHMWYSDDLEILDHIDKQPTIQPDPYTVNRQAAIDVCNNAIDLWHGQLGEGIVIAVKKKIEELPPAQPVDKDINVHSTDTISRQVAINALHDEIVRRRIDEDTCDDGTLDEFDTEAILRRLPPAQPEIIRCEDCKHWSRESICDGFCSEDCMRHDEEFYCGYAEKRIIVVRNDE